MNADLFPTPDLPVVRWLIFSRARGKKAVPRFHCVVAARTKARAIATARRQTMAGPIIEASRETPAQLAETARSLSRQACGNR